MPSVPGADDVSNTSTVNMKVLSIGLLRCEGVSEPIMLCQASDLASFGFFQRGGTCAAASGSARPCRPPLQLSGAVPRSHPPRHAALTHPALQV